jgi:glycosyltransferase involved in cell wall biosynthesis
VKKPTISLIVNTYENPRALAKVLAALSQQRLSPLEIIIADDGSGEATKKVIEQSAQTSCISIRHCWQVNQGFRRAMILNQAIAMSRGEYLVFLDGDSVPDPDFIRDHTGLAEEGFFVQCRRAFVDEGSVGNFEIRNAWRLAIQGKLSGWTKVLRLPVPLVIRGKHQRGILGCNLAIWREDLITVNGYDENFIGWGREDSDLANRLYHLGRQRKFVYGRAIVYHLNHPLAPRSWVDKNQEALDMTIAERRVRAIKGLDAYPISVTAKRELLPVSACLIARNAAATLPRCLAGLKSLVSEIVLVHNECSDDTVAIAQAAGARTIEKKWEGYRDQKNFAASQATQPWVLTIDADEEISPTLAQSIREFIQKNDNRYTGATSPRVTWLIDRWIRHGDWYPDNGIRLFRQGQGRWTGGKVHEKLEVVGRLFKLRGELLHHAFPCFEAFQVRNTHYAKLAAQTLCENNKRWSWSKAFFRPIWRFLRGYIFRQGFLDGVPGFLIAWQNGQTVFLRAAYHYEGMKIGKKS